jgi:hypothetical protein
VQYYRFNMYASKGFRVPPDIVEFINYCQAIGIDSAKFIKKVAEKF